MRTSSGAEPATAAAAPAPMAAAAGAASPAEPAAAPAAEQRAHEPSAAEPAVVAPAPAMAAEEQAAAPAAAAPVAGRETSGGSVPQAESVSQASTQPLRRRITPPTAGTAKRARWTVGQVGVQQAPAASWRISCRRRRRTCRRSSRHHPRTDRARGLPRGVRRGPRLRQGAHLWRKPTSAESSVCDLSQLSHATHVILPTYRSRQLLIVISMHWHTGTMMQQHSICSRELTSFCYMSESVWNVVHRGAKETDRRRRRRG